MDQDKSTYENIPALPASYRGVTFRSRLEARWAYYFDLIGCDWQYEPEGYGLASGNYCPDFWRRQARIQIQETSDQLPIL